jgi:hypothetical protein
MFIFRDHEKENRILNIKFLVLVISSHRFEMSKLYSHKVLYVVYSLMAHIVLGNPYTFWRPQLAPSNKTLRFYEIVWKESVVYCWLPLCKEGTRFKVERLWKSLTAGGFSVKFFFCSTCHQQIFYARPWVLFLSSPLQLTLFYRKFEWNDK